MSHTRASPLAVQKRDFDYKRTHDHALSPRELVRVCGTRRAHASRPRSEPPRRHANTRRSPRPHANRHMLPRPHANRHMSPRPHANRHISPDPMQLDPGHPTACKYGLHHANPKSYTHTEMNSYFVQTSLFNTLRQTSLRSATFKTKQDQVYSRSGVAASKVKTLAAKTQESAFSKREKNIESDLNRLLQQFSKTESSIERQKIQKEALERQMEGLKQGLESLEAEKVKFINNVRA